MTDAKPLAAAAHRLRDVPGFPGRPGRPRKHAAPALTATNGAPPTALETPAAGTARAHPLAQTRINSGGNGGAPVQESGRPSPSMLSPRLLTLPMASAYLSLARTTLLDLEAAGALRRARVVVRGREIRKRLYDRAALDRLADGWTA